MPNPILVISHIFLVKVANTGLLSLLLLGWLLLPRGKDMFHWNSQSAQSELLLFSVLWCSFSVNEDN